MQKGGGGGGTGQLGFSLEFMVSSEKKSDKPMQIRITEGMAWGASLISTEIASSLNHTNISDS
jgi:hypothetical protein